MKKLNMAISLDDIVLIGEDKTKTSVQLFADGVKNLILAKANQSPARGLNEDERYTYYKICDKFKEAIKTGALEIKFEDAEYKMIKEAKKLSFIPNDLLRRIEEAIT